MGILLGLVLAWSSTADAHPGHAHYRPAPRAHTRVVVVSPRPTVALRWGPWSVHYFPAPRDGYVWVSGAWAGTAWVPGHWRPTGRPPMPNQVWVDGHWEGEDYIDGHWRIDHIDGMIWVDGEYDEFGAYHEGAWIEPAAPEDTPLAIPRSESPW